MRYPLYKFFTLVSKLIECKYVCFSFTYEYSGAALS